MLELTQGHIDRAFRIARWYGRSARRAEISDLESAALEGLAKAARDWSPRDEPSIGRGADVRRSFWGFAWIRIVGEMRDELRRVDHLTRPLRAKVVEDANGACSIDEESLDWINPNEPLSLTAIAHAEDESTVALIEQIEEPRNAIEDFELLDALHRASEALPERARSVVILREVQGYPNRSLAQALEVTEGRASQLCGKALEQMRAHIGDSLLDVS